MDAEDLRKSFTRQDPAAGEEPDGEDPVGEDSVGEEPDGDEPSSASDDSTPVNMDPRESFTIDDPVKQAPVRDQSPPPPVAPAPVAVSRSLGDDKVVPENRESSPSKRFYVIVAAVVILSLIVILSLMLSPLLDKSETSYQSAPPPYGLANYTYKQYLSDFSAAINGGDSGLAALPSDSPRGKALNWIRNEDTGVDIKTTPITLLLERYVVAVMYYAMGGGSEALKDDFGFLSEASVCEWKNTFYNGVWCNSDSKVKEINIVDTELLGTIPTEIALLQKLETLHIAGLVERAEIPSEIGNLEFLDTLKLVDASLAGRVPTEIGLISSLTLLDLSNNYLSGNAPKELGFLYYLRALWLSDNRLTGSIPTELGFLTGLTLLDLRENSFSGNIVTTLGSLTNLKRLRLDNNDLGGTIPRELDSLTKLERFSLQINEKLTGDLDPLCASIESVGLEAEADCATNEVFCFCCFCH